MAILVTGGAGFIGGNFVLDWIAGCDEPVANLDKLTYAGNLETLASLQSNPRHIFVQGDIGDCALVEKLLAEHKPRAVVNFAAECHVDRSIHAPVILCRPTLWAPSTCWSLCGGIGVLCPKRQMATLRSL